MKAKYFTGLALLLCSLTLLYFTAKLAQLESSRELFRIKQECHKPQQQEGLIDAAYRF